MLNDIVPLDHSRISFLLTRRWPRQNRQLSNDLRAVAYRAAVIASLSKTATKKREKRRKKEKRRGRRRNGGGG